MKLWSELCLMLSEMACEESVMSSVQLPILWLLRVLHELHGAMGILRPSGRVG